MFDKANLSLYVVAMCEVTGDNLDSFEDLDFEVTNEKKHYDLDKIEEIMCFVGRKPDSLARVVVHYGLCLGPFKCQMLFQNWTSRVQNLTFERRKYRYLLFS